LTKVIAALALLAPVSLALAQDAAAPAVAPATAAPAAATNADRVVIQVGDEKMTAKQFADLLGPQAAAMPPAHRAQMADRIVQLILLAQEARKRGFESDFRVHMAVQQALAQIMVETATKPYDEATLKKMYDADKVQFEQVKARHVLVRAQGSPAPLAPGAKELTDAEAKTKAEAIRDRIVNKKEDFATVAKAESDEPAAKTSGGDLGLFSRGMMSPAFEQAAFGLKDGEISEPVKTEFGWHIIQTQEHKTPTFDQVKAEDAQQGGRKINELLAQLKKTADIKIDDAFFKAPAAQPAMPALPAGHPAIPSAAPAK
jgi:peptidyl-prolyl cis-trans isomerase C